MRILARQKKKTTRSFLLHRLVIMLGRTFVVVFSLCLFFMWLIDSGNQNKATFFSAGSIFLKSFLLFPQKKVRSSLRCFNGIAKIMSTFFGRRFFSLRFINYSNASSSNVGTLWTNQWNVSQKKKWIKSEWISVKLRNENGAFISFRERWIVNVCRIAHTWFQYRTGIDCFSFRSAGFMTCAHSMAAFSLDFMP